MIYHITFSVAWDEAIKNEIYSTPTFGEEGFIHCSEQQQLVDVANRIFKGKKELVLLCIDESKVEGRIVRENLEGGAILYPHIYAPLNVSAVERVIVFNASENGLFQLPVEIR